MPDAYPDYDLVDWVLGKFPEADFNAINDRLADIKSAVELILQNNIDEAMQRYSK